MRIQLLMTHGKNNESFKAKLHKQSVGKRQISCKQLQISAPNGLVRRDFSVVPDSVFLFSENSQIFLWSFLKFFSNF
jgi:hypothetical protein